MKVLEMPEVNHQSSRENRIRLVIKHPNIDLRNVTDVIGLVPNACWQSGDPVITPAGTTMPGKHTFSLWSYSQAFGKDASILSKVSEILDVLEPNSSFIVNLEASGGTVNIFLDILGDFNIGGVIPWSGLNRLANLKINLGFEVFPG